MYNSYFNVKCLYLLVFIISLDTPVAGAYIHGLAGDIGVKYVYATKIEFYSLF
jgi:hypothetical protein